MFAVCAMRRWFEPVLPLADGVFSMARYFVGKYRLLYCFLENMSGVRVRSYSAEVAGPLF